jgi:predicted DNA binding protein
MVMSETADGVGSHLTLRIWHPECWTLKVTEANPGGILGHGVYSVGETLKGRFTVYAESASDLETLVEAIDTSPLTKSVSPLASRGGVDAQVPGTGNASRSLIVEYGDDHSINDALVSKGFIPDKAVWIHDGREYWTVVVEADREGIRNRLDTVRESMDAEIEVQRIVADPRESDGVLSQGLLSERQRDVFNLARRRGYYNWPREVSATDLAEELGVSKATALEHLRKAESKLFDVLP